MKKWLLGGLALFAFGALVVAQVPSLIIPSPTGLEQIEVFVPSSGGVVTNPLKEQVTINTIRSASGYTLVAAGTTVTTATPNSSVVVLATGAITTWNLALPLAPADGQDFVVGCPGGNVGTLTITATAPSGVAIVGTNPTSCTAATPTSATFKYSLSANTWYRAS